jgi:hypothetical protein
MKSERCRNGKEWYNHRQAKKFYQETRKKKGEGVLKPQRNYVGTRMKI